MATDSQTFTSSAVAKITKVVRDVSQDAGDDGNEKQPLQDIGPDNLRVKIASNAGGGGKYWCTLLKLPTSDIEASGNLAETDVGTAFTPSKSSIKILGLNLPETGQTTHALDVGSIHNAQVLRRQSNGITVVTIEAYALSDDCGSSS